MRETALLETQFFIPNFSTTAYISWANKFYFQFARCGFCRNETPSLVCRNKNLETTGKKEVSCQSYFKGFLTN